MSSPKVPVFLSLSRKAYKASDFLEFYNNLLEKNVIDDPLINQIGKTASGTRLLTVKVDNVNYNLARFALLYSVLSKESTRVYPLPNHRFVKHFTVSDTFLNAILYVREKIGNIDKILDEVPYYDVSDTGLILTRATNGSNHVRFRGYEVKTTGVRWLLLRAYLYARYGIQ